MALNDVTEDDCRLYRLFVTFKRLIDEPEAKLTTTV